MEWEYAARAGVSEDFWTADGAAFASGDTCTGQETLIAGVSNVLASLYTNYCGQSDYGTVEVASLLANANGLFDMHGNVAEWTVDDSSCTFPANFVDPYCATGSSEKVVRGGSWVDSLFDQTTSSALYVPSTHVDQSNGVRLVRTQ